MKLRLHKTYYTSSSIFWISINGFANDCFYTDYAFRETKIISLNILTRDLLPVNTIFGTGCCCGFGVQNTYGGYHYLYYNI